MKNDLTTYQIYLMLLGYLTEQNDNTAQILRSMLVELYRRADKAESEGIKMPHSLRARLSGLRYQKIISDKDYCRLCKALDNEGVLDKIKSEIKQIELNGYIDTHTSFIRGGAEVKNLALEIINKHMGEQK